MSATDTADLERLRALPGARQRQAEEPVFHEPWQARLFALTVALCDRGLFDWTDWSDALGRSVAAMSDVPPQEDRSASQAYAAVYYAAWSDALARLLAERDALAEQDVADCAAEWQSAAERTPHGQPINLDRPRSPASPTAPPRVRT